MKRCPLCFLLVMLVLYGLPRSTPAETFAYIPSEDGNVTRVDTTEDEETFDSVEFSANDALFGAAVTPNGLYLLVTDGGDLSSDGNLTMVTTSSFLISSAQIDIPVGVNPQGVAVDTQGSFAYVANFDDDNLSRINMATLSASSETISVGGDGYGPMGVVVFYDEVDDVNKVYVANNKIDKVSVIFDDGVTATLEDRIDVGTKPVGIAITPDGSFVYVANNGSDNVSIIRTSDNTVIATQSVGNEPWGVAVGADGDFVYVTNSNVDSTGTDSVSVIATSTQTVQTFFEVNQPMGVAAPKNGDFAYVVNQGDDTITRIDMDTESATTFGGGEISNASALGAFIGGTPPSAPSGLAATEQSYDEIELTWTDNSDDESGFKIERREDSEEGFTQIAKVDADETTYSDDGLSGETTYHYRVRAFNEAADSDYTTEAGATTEEGRFSWCFIQTLLR